MASRIVVTPRKNESGDRMIKRFSRKVRKCGVLQEARDRAYFVKPSQKRRNKINKAKFYAKKAAADKKTQ